MESLLTICGSVASLVGAVFSWRKARLAEISALDATRVRDQVLGHKQTLELSRLEASCRKAQNAIRKYGPASNETSLQGVNHTADAEVVQEFLLLLGEHKDLFKTPDGNDAEKMCESVNSLLDKFAQAESVDTRRES